MLRRRTSDDCMAEDIAQETLVKALTRLDTLDLTLPLWPWLKTIATNLLIDHARRSGRELMTDDPVGATGVEFSPEDDDGTLLQAIENLPQKQQVAVSLRYLQGWKTTEAANFLGMGRPAFEQLLFRARRKLRTEYGRLQESALGLALLPLRWSRRLAWRISQQTRDANGFGPTTLIGSDAAVQLASGLLALATAIGGIAPVTDTAPLPT
ncbi:MAG TPA: RNA polymerase sigma factor, partial [Actinomycetota bacterium]|nr:RNA polymerase sigma factor [Actinomycetota bacterium]